MQRVDERLTDLPVTRHRLRSDRASGPVTRILAPPAPSQSVAVTPVAVGSESVMLETFSTPNELIVSYGKAEATS